MRSSSKKLEKGDESISLKSVDIPEQQSYFGSTFLVPGSEFSNLSPTGANVDPGGSSAPEKLLTLFALRLAVLEKAASSLGTLGFVWATTVLLGGFASTLKATDFLFVTVILLIEGARIFSRSHELEWATKTQDGRLSFRVIVSSPRSLFRAVKLIFRPVLVAQSDGRLSDDIQLSNRRINRAVVQNSNRSKNISSILHWLQFLSAIACAVLSLTRLMQQDFDENTDDTRNQRESLNIFYALTLEEALIFLFEKAYWEFTVNYSKLLERVCKESELGVTGMVLIKRFFYDAYSCCINGSVFDGLKMDFISFAGGLLDSDLSDEQLIGIRILQKFVMSNRLAHDTLCKIGTSASVIERLIEMLNWKNPAEEEIRRSAAEIVSKLAGKKQNVLRVAAITGAMESISCLLYTGASSDAKPHDIHPRTVVADAMDYEFSVFNLLGLLILKKLAHDHDNCGKIGNARGLLGKIIGFTHASENLLRDESVPESQIKAVKRSLQLVRMLVSTTAQTGKDLRKDVSDIVFTVSNIRAILQYGERHMELQKLGIEILTGMAMDEDAREKIGNTGGVIKLLILIFFKPGLTDEQNSVSVEAGEALAMLALESKGNCTRILKEWEVVERLVSTLNEPVIRINSSRILRNLCDYTGTESFDCLKGVTAAVPIVLNAVMVEEGKLLEVSVGLAAQILRFTSPEGYDEEFTRADIKDTAIAEKVVQILKTYDYPEIKVPRIRRFVIELAIQMMESQEKYILLFKNLAMEEVLERVEETTSELESFNVFSGSVGLSRHKTTISSLVETALELMCKD